MYANQISIVPVMDAVTPVTAKKPRRLFWWKRRAADQEATQPDNGNNGFLVIIPGFGYAGYEVLAKKVNKTDYGITMVTNGSAIKLTHKTAAGVYVTNELLELLTQNHTSNNLKLF